MRFHDSPPVAKSKKLSAKLFERYSDESINPHLMILKRYSLFGVYKISSAVCRIPSQSDPELLVPLDTMVSRGTSRM
mgnify:CR=1 FL=1